MRNAHSTCWNADRIPNVVRRHARRAGCAVPTQATDPMTEQHSDDRPAAGEAGMSPTLAPALSSGSRRSTYYPHIDGLRAIAVIAVIVYHLQATWLPGGFGGVDVFFLVSGFVVSASVGNWNRGGIAAFFGYFYARRMQ